MAGGVLAAVIYYALHVIPIALTAFLIPIVFLPLGALCLVLSVRTMGFSQPMFEDVPREHPDVYKQLARDIWRSAVAVAALGSASIQIAHAHHSLGKKTLEYGIVGGRRIRGRNKGVVIERTI